MAKLYKVRKKCLICGNVFYPRYAGSLYCEDCKNRKKETVKSSERKKPEIKKTIKKKVPKESKKSPSKKAVSIKSKKKPKKK
jgi:uncharacterized OB-fold protein